MLLKTKIKEISKKGNEWLEPFSDFVNCALRAQKIAREKNSCHDLAIMAKTVGSNYFLENQRLQLKYKYPGFQALAAEGGAACAKKISTLLRDRDSNPNFRFQGATCYHYTIPQYLLRLILTQDTFLPNFSSLTIKYCG